MATLTAGQNSSFKGFAAAGNAIGLPTFGSFDTAPFAGVTTQYIYTTDGTNGSIGLTGNQSPSFFGGQIYVDGVAWAVTYTAYDGTHTSYSLTPANGTGFVNATNYNVSLTSAPVDPNITSAAAVTNLVNTTLAHTITADKTIASTAIIGGADAAAFEINGTNQLRFASNAASSALGSLVVQIQITDNDGLTDTQTITVTVKAIVFKASKFYSRAGATSTAPVILTDFSNPLTGANSIAAAIGDTIVAFPAIGSNADRDMIVNSGYAEHADHYVNGTTYDANIGLFTKTLTSTETSLTIGSSGSANDAQAMILMLFQGVDATTPMDVSVVLDQGTGTGKPNPAAITPATPGAIAIFGGAQAAATAVALTSSDLTAFTQRVQADTNDIGVGAGFIEWSGGGAIDPAVFGGGASNAANSWATISAVLRPAWTAGGGGSDGALTSAATGSGSITGQRTASSPATASATGSASATGRATSQGDVSASGTGTASAVGRGIVTAALSASASGAGSIEGASVVVSAGAISGAGQGSGAISGAASSATALTGTALGSGSIDGRSTRAGASAGAAVASASITALSSAASAVSATGAGTVSVSGNAIRPAILAASATGSGAVTGRSTAASDLSATGSGTASISSASNTTVVGALASSGSSSSSIVGRQVVAGSLSASALGQAAIVGTGVRTAAFAALAASSGLAIGAASVSAEMAGAGVGSGLLSGALVNAAAVSGVGAGSSHIDGQRLIMATLNGMAVSIGAIVGFSRITLPASEARTVATALASRTANSNETARDVSTAPNPRDQVTAVGSRDARSVRLAR